MTSRERVFAALRAEAVDRVPFAVWRHFYSKEAAGARALAETLVAWARAHGLDLLKYNPRAHYHAEPWGTRYRYDGDARPTLLQYGVRETRDWERLEPVGPRHPVFAEMLEGLRIARAAFPDVPLLMTIFTPLAVLERLGGPERVVADLRGAPEAVLHALAVVTQTFRAFATACLEAGADGIFLATTGWGSRDSIGDEDYERFGRPFDLRVLEAVRDAPLNVLHVCGEDTRVVKLADYPVAAVSWNAHGAGNPGLGAFLARVPDRAAIGGISDGAFTSADLPRVHAEVARAVGETHGESWIAAGGCTIPTDANPAAIDAARRMLVEGAQPEKVWRARTP